MFDICNVLITAGSILFIVASYYVRSEHTMASLTSCLVNRVMKVAFVGTIVGVIIYYFRNQEKPKRPTSHEQASPTECNEKEHERRHIDCVVSGKRKLDVFEIKLNNHVFDQVLMPKETEMVSPDSTKNQYKIAQSYESPIISPKQQSPIVLDPASKWSNESGTPMSFKKYKSSANLDTLFEHPEEFSGGNHLPKALNIENIPENSFDYTDNNISKRSNVSVDCYDIVDMDLDDEPKSNPLELTPSPVDFENLNISKSTEHSTCAIDDAQKKLNGNDLESQPNLFHESFELEVSLDSCANISLNTDLKLLEESRTQNRSLPEKSFDNNDNNHSTQKQSNRSDSAIGSDMADEDHQIIGNASTDHNSIGFDQVPNKNVPNVIASKPASHTTGSTFTSTHQINHHQEFEYNSSKIPIMKELEYRRTHLRPVKRHD